MLRLNIHLADFYSLVLDILPGYMYYPIPDIQLYLLK